MAPKKKMWRIALVLAVLLVPAALVLLPRFRYSREILFTELALGAALVAWWALLGRRPAARLGRGTRVVTALLGLCFLGSLVAGADAAVQAWDFMSFHWVSDQGLYQSPCGPFGLDAPRYDARALAAARAAFPHQAVKIMRGCRLLEAGPQHDVVLRVGRFSAPPRATRLVIAEDVTLDTEDGPATLFPYEAPSDVLADLARIDRYPPLGRALGDAPRLCGVGLPGAMTGPAFVCQPLSALGAARSAPTAWPHVSWRTRCAGEGAPEAGCFRTQMRKVSSTR